MWRSRSPLAASAALALLGCGLALFGCNSLFGVDGLTYEAGPAAGGGGSSSGDGGATGGGCSYDVGGCRCLLDDGACVGLPDLSGWTTHVQRYTGAPENQPSCLSPLVVGSTSPNTVTCPTCACAAPTVACQVAATFWSDNVCGASSLDVAFDDQTCSVVDSNTVWAAADLSFQVTGSCAPVGTPVMPSDTFVAACETTTSCSPGCLPIADKGFDDRLCVAHDGDVPCPPGFDERHAVYAGEELCTPCTCGPVTGSSCALDLYFNETDCTGSWITRSSGQTCNSIGNPPPLSGQATIPQKGSCAPSGGMPLPQEGIISQTVCCRSAG